MNYSLSRCLIAALSAGIILLLPIALANAAETITIVANHGKFSSFETAAGSEEQVNWQDEDKSDDNACTESYAAVELKTFLPNICKYKEQDIKLVKSDNLPTSGHVFLLGTRDSNLLIDSFNAPGDRRANLSRPESFCIRSFEQNQRIVTIIEGADRIGVLYGVYAYLEKLGIGFYGLGEQGTVYPKRIVNLPADLKLTEKPHYLTRGFFTKGDWNDNDEFFLWMARNRLNLWTADQSQYRFLKKLGIKLTAGAHDIQELFLNPHSEYPYNCSKYKGDENKPEDPYSAGSEYLGDINKDGRLTYAEVHPEWYVMLGGQRDAHKHKRLRGNYCTSNADATSELAENLIQCLVDGQWAHADMVNFWMLDGGTWCQCQACKKSGIPSDRLCQLIHTVNSRIQEARRQGRLKRNVPLVTLAYSTTLSPPTRPLPKGFDYDNISMTFFPIMRCYVHSFADPACTECNQLLLKDFRGWSGGPGSYYKGSIFIGEYYNVSNIKTLPVLFPRIMAIDIPWFFRNGARHFHYMHTPTRLWGTWTLNQYLMGRLLWNIDIDVDVILNDYFGRYYPTTTETTRSFYQHLEHATANIKPLKHYIRSQGQPRNRYTMRFGLTSEDFELFPTKHLRYESYHPVTNDGPDIVEMMESMRLARGKINAALSACTDPVEKVRLVEDERRFAYGETMYKFYYHLLRTTMFHRKGDKELARREFIEVDRQADILRGIVDLVNVTFRHASAKNGYEASYLQAAYELYKKHYGKKE
ncbi:MAG: DUF4838 domain-containing protein [Planctomycetes bacterium]|nr:DUF4838 domain-containing protein [Planctomycetota bacterium]